MDMVEVKVVGTMPMMMHNGAMVDPRNAYVKQIRELTGKRTKTEDDHVQIALLEFMGGMYYDDKLGPFIPAQNIDATIRGGARLLKRGKMIERGVYLMEDRIKLEYTGTRERVAMFDAGFSDIRNVRIGTSQVMRCRPIFNPPWWFTFTLAYDKEVISSDDLRLCVEYAGKRIGLNDGRTIRYGRFEIAEWSE